MEFLKSNLHLCCDHDTQQQFQEKLQTSALKIENFLSLSNVLSSRPYAREKDAKGKNQKLPDWPFTVFWKIFSTVIIQYGLSKGKATGL